MIDLVFDFLDGDAADEILASSSNFRFLAACPSSTSSDDSDIDGVLAEATRLFLLDFFDEVEAGMTFSFFLRSRR